jgi:hypothetical protein
MDEGIVSDRNIAVERGDRMKLPVILMSVLALWFVMQIWILPKLGVKT